MRKVLLICLFLPIFCFAQQDKGAEIRENIQRQVENAKIQTLNNQTISGLTIFKMTEKLNQSGQSLVNSSTFLGLSIGLQVIGAVLTSVGASQKEGAGLVYAGLGISSVGFAFQIGSIVELGRSGKRLREIKYQ